MRGLRTVYVLQAAWALLLALAVYVFAVLPSQAPVSISASLYLERAADGNFKNQFYTPPPKNNYFLIRLRELVYDQGPLLRPVPGGAGLGIVPPPGARLVTIKAQVRIQSGAHAGANAVLKCIKNATVDEAGFLLTGEDGLGRPSAMAAQPGSRLVEVNCDDAPKPDDYYNVFVQIDPAVEGGQVEIDGHWAHTRLQVTVLMR